MGALVLKSTLNTITLVFVWNFTYMSNLNSKFAIIQISHLTWETIIVIWVSRLSLDEFAHRDMWVYTYNKEYVSLSKWGVCSKCDSNEFWPKHRMRLELRVYSHILRIT